MEEWKLWCGEDVIVDRRRLSRGEIEGSNCIGSLSSEWWNFLRKKVGVYE